MASAKTTDRPGPPAFPAGTLSNLALGVALIGAVILQTDSPHIMVLRMMLSGFVMALAGLGAGMLAADIFRTKGQVGVLNCAIGAAFVGFLFDPLPAYMGSPLFMIGGLIAFASPLLRLRAKTLGVVLLALGVLWVLVTAADGALSAGFDINRNFAPDLWILMIPLGMWLGKVAWNEATGRYQWPAAFQVSALVAGTVAFALKFYLLCTPAGVRLAEAKWYTNLNSIFGNSSDGYRIGITAFTPLSLGIPDVVMNLSLALAVLVLLGMLPKPGNRNLLAALGAVAVSAFVIHSLFLGLPATIGKDVEPPLEVSMPADRVLDNELQPGEDAHFLALVKQRAASLDPAAVAADDYAAEMLALPQRILTTGNNWVDVFEVPDIEGFADLRGVSELVAATRERISQATSFADVVAIRDDASAALQPILREYWATQGIDYVDDYGWTVYTPASFPLPIRADSLVPRGLPPYATLIDLALILGWAALWCYGLRRRPADLIPEKVRWIK